MRKFICPHCSQIVDVDEHDVQFTCPNCGDLIRTDDAFRTTQSRVNSLVRSANQFYENAYSYSAAYTDFKTLHQLIPDNLDFILGMLISQLKTSSLKNNVIDDYIKSFNENNIELDSTTYIRVGHFFDESVNAVIRLQKKLISMYENANENKKVLIAYNLLTFIKFYSFIFDNLGIFTEEEYRDSIFISMDEIGVYRDKLVGFLNELTFVSFKLGNIDEATIYTKGKNVNINEFNFDDYNDVEDEKLFGSNSSGIKLYKYIFAGLIICFIGMTAGLILVFALPKNIQYIGLIVLGVSAVAFGGVYIYHFLTRKKVLRELNN